LPDTASRTNTKSPITPARAECARSTVAEALKALEWAGALTDGDRLSLETLPKKTKIVRRRVPDGLGTSLSMF
jgi:hypothetical protein